MILSQIYHTNRKYMSDGNLNKWKAYESLENVPVPEKMDFSPAPIRVQDFFFENFSNESATKLGWYVNDDLKVQFFTFQFADSVSWKMEPLRAQQSDTV